MRKGNGWDGPVVGNLTTKNSNVWNSQIQQKTRESEFKRCHLSRKSSRKKYEGIIVQVRRCSGLFVCRMSPDCKGHNCHPKIIVGFQ